MKRSQPTTYVHVVDRVLGQTLAAVPLHCTDFAVAAMQSFVRTLSDPAVVLHLVPLYCPTGLCCSFLVHEAPSCAALIRVSISPAPPIPFGSSVLP